MVGNSCKPEVFQLLREGQINLASVLKMAEVDILAISAFLRPGHLQYPGAGWNGGQQMRYQTYFMQKGSDLEDAILFSYSVSLGSTNVVSGTD